MPEEIEGAERSSSGWRVVTSAWLVAMVFGVLFAAVEALASLHSAPLGKASLAGAVIPQHDAGFIGPNDVAASDWLERAKAEAYSTW